MFGLQQKLCKGIFDDSRVLNSTCAVYNIFEIIIELHHYDLLIRSAERVAILRIIYHILRKIHLGV